MVNAPFDLEYWLITLFAGSEFMFFGIAIITIAALAAYFRMNNMIALSMLGLFMMIFASYVDIAGFYLLTLMAIVFFVYILMARTFR